MQRQRPVQLDQPRRGHRRRRNPGEKIRRQRRIRVLEGEMHRHAPKDRQAAELDNRFTGVGRAYRSRNGTCPQSQRARTALAQFRARTVVWDGVQLIARCRLDDRARIRHPIVGKLCLNQGGEVFFHFGKVELALIPCLVGGLQCGLIAGPVFFDPLRHDL